MFRLLRKEVERKVKCRQRAVNCLCCCGARLNNQVWRQSLTKHGDCSYAKHLVTGLKWLELNWYIAWWSLQTVCRQTVRLFGPLLLSMCWHVDGFIIGPLISLLLLSTFRNIWAWHTLSHPETEFLSGNILKGLILQFFTVLRWKHFR